jgi:hypothetical protein
VLSNASPFLDRDCTNATLIMAFIFGYLVIGIFIGKKHERTNE